jgi:hypothetical protein
MSDPTSMSAATSASEDPSIRPFPFHASDEAHADLRRRIAGPGSIIEQLKMIAPLTNPTAHGGSAPEVIA